jgi:deoxyribodipyrimidine photo-lyase
MKTAIVWFRNDLRIYDHEALHRAVEHFDQVLPVYVIDKEKLHKEAYGSRKMGARRMQFILESLADLHEGLQALGAGLHIALGKLEEVLPALCKEFKATAVYAHKEVTREEVHVEEALRLALGDGVALKFYWGATLYHINDLPFSHAHLPDVFTEFRKLVEKQSKVRNCFPSPKAVALPALEETGAARKPPFGNIPSLESLAFTSASIDPRAAIVLKGGEAEAWKRLDHYFHDSEQLATYKDTRNGMLGADYSSKLSAWLAHGCISARAIYAEVQDFERSVKKNQSTYWMIFELIWRDYFRFVATKFGDKLFYPGGIRDERPQVSHDDARIEAWKAGRTGIPFVDANMIELRETGFMSNRGRQNVASFFVKDLQQDWRMGAAWFEEQLIDYDVASNWGNWAYVAGVGNDPREERYFNMLTQAQRYDSGGGYVKHWLPELANVDARNVHTPWQLGKDEKALYEINDTCYDRPLLVPKGWEQR